MNTHNAQRNTHDDIRNTKSIILCADYGPKFNSIVKNTAKALLPVRGRPIIEYIVNKLQLLNTVNEILIVTNNRFYKHFKGWLETYASNVPIRILDNGTHTFKNMLGAMNDLALVLDKERITEDLILLGGDNIFSFTLNRFVDYAQHRRPQPVIALYHTHNNLDTRQLGVARLDHSKKVVEFTEKPPKRKPAPLISMCLYFFPKESLSWIKKYCQTQPELNGIGSYIEWLLQKDTIYGYTFEDGTWLDVGDLNAYTEAVCSF